MNDISHLGSLGNLLGILQGDLQAVILHVILCLHHFLFRIHEKIAGFPVNFHLHVIRFAEMVFARRKQGILNRLKKCLLADFFFFFQNIQRFH